METQELIKRVKDNDEEAFIEISEQFRPMIYSFIQSNHLDQGDYSINREDLFQEGLIALYEACKLYDENRAASFHTFAHVVVQRRIKRIYMQQYRRYKHECYSIDVIKDGVSYDNLKKVKVNEDPELNYQRKEKYNELLRYYDSLTRVEKDIINLRNKHYTYKQISDYLNISEKTIDNRIQKIRRQFRRIKELEKLESISR